MKARRFVAFAWALAAWVLAAPAPAHAGFHLVKKVVLGGDGGWDDFLVDANARRVYISRGSHVMVLDADTYAIVGDIPNTQGVHGIAVAPGAGRGFTSNGRDTSVTIFDLETLKEVGRVRTGLRPDAIVFDPVSGRVFTMNAGSNDATAIDAATGKVAGTVALAGRPEFAEVDGAGHLYVNLEDSSQVQVVDTKALTAGARWSVAPGEEPSGLAIDVRGHRLFSVCGNKKMVVTDAASGKVLADLPIGSRVDGAGYDQEKNLAFASNGEGTLTVVSAVPGAYKVLESPQTAVGARTMRLDPRTHHVLLITAEFGPTPAPEPGQKRPPRAPMLPGTFQLLVFGE